MSSRSAAWSEGGFELVDAPPQPLPEGWARMRVEACGICGSDLYAWREPSERPIGGVPGHEFAGTVLDGPAGLADRLYAASPHVVCGRCEFCVAGSICREGLGFMGRDQPGGFAEKVDVPVENLYPVHGSVSPLVASLSEPLAVCVRALRLAAAEPGSRLLITGAGTLGLLSVLLARDRVSRIGVLARYPHQRALVEQLGATALGEDDWREWAQEHHPNVVIQTAGSGDALNVAMKASRPGGRLVVVGLMGSVPVDMDLVTFMELSIIGSIIYGAGPMADFAVAVDLLPRWQPELALLQNHQFKLESIEEAFRCASDKSTGAVKVSVTR